MRPAARRAAVAARPAAPVLAELREPTARLQRGCMPASRQVLVGPGPIAHGISTRRLGPQSRPLRRAAAGCVHGVKSIAKVFDNGTLPILADHPVALEHHTSFELAGRVSFRLVGILLHTETE